MDTSAIDNLLGQLRAATATGSQPARAAAAPVKGTDFATLLKNSLDGINGSQVNATRLARDFELGAPNVNLNDCNGLDAEGEYIVPGDGAGAQPAGLGLP